MATFVVEYFRSQPGDVGVADSIIETATLQEARDHAADRLFELHGDPDLKSHEKPTIARIHDMEGFPGGVPMLELYATSKGIAERLG